MSPPAAVGVLNQTPHGVIDLTPGTVVVPALVLELIDLRPCRPNRQLIR